jgi:hypothetical protein
LVTAVLLVSVFVLGVLVGRCHLYPQKPIPPPPAGASVLKGTEESKPEDRTYVVPEPGSTPAADRLVTLTAAKEGLELRLELQPERTQGRLLARLIVFNRSRDSKLWLRAFSDAYWSGWAFFSEADGRLLGLFQDHLNLGHRGDGGSIVIPLDLTYIREVYQETPYQRSAVGRGKIGVFVFMNFDNKQVLSRPEEILNHSLHSNTVYLDPRGWR